MFEPMLGIWKYARQLKKSSSFRGLKTFVARPFLQALSLVLVVGPARVRQQSHEDCVLLRSVLQMCHQLRCVRVEWFSYKVFLAFAIQNRPTVKNQVMLES
jgi:hypothetical protein